MSYVHHHTAIKTRDIERSVQFYSLLGLVVDVRFKTGAARAAWLRASSTANVTSGDGRGSSAAGPRLELIEVPSYMGPAPKALDLAADANMAVLGLNHLALDVSEAVRAPTTHRWCMPPPRLRGEAGMPNYTTHPVQFTGQTFGWVVGLSM